MELHARSLWLLSEPLHAVCYFDDRCRRLGKDLGLKGFWMGYFASRTAPMGAVEPAAATAVLGVFAPGMVARALPAAWSVVSPAHVLDERGSRAAQALRAIDPGLERTAAAVLPPLQTIVDEAPAPARPLFAANRALSRRCQHSRCCRCTRQCGIGVEPHRSLCAGERMVCSAARNTCGPIRCGV
ncbi:hypothetical protein ACFXPQ_05325 [Streptomyces lydicus]|uniref:SCO6745 family protein n=1 Tax=Streptomyces lydicus TaxID=47763 RepID=UPI0036B3862D